MRLTSHFSQSHILHLTSHNLTSHILHLTSHISHLTSHISHLTSHILLAFAVAPWEGLITAHSATGAAGATN